MNIKYYAIVAVRYAVERGEECFQQHYEIMCSKSGY